MTAGLLGAGCAVILFALMVWALFAGAKHADGAHDVEPVPEAGDQQCPPAGPVESYWQANKDLFVSPSSNDYLSPLLSDGIRRLEEYANDPRSHR